MKFVLATNNPTIKDFIESAVERIKHGKKAEEGAEDE